MKDLSHCQLKIRSEYGAQHFVPLLQKVAEIFAHCYVDTGPKALHQ